MGGPLKWETKQLPSGEWTLLLEASLDPERVSGLSNVQVHEEGTHKDVLLLFGINRVKDLKYDEGEASTHSKLRFKLTKTTDPWVESQEAEVQCQMEHTTEMFT